MANTDEQVNVFAQQIEALLTGVLGDQQTPYVQIDFMERTQRYIISTNENSGIPLSTEGYDVLALDFEYECKINSSGYLAIYQSSIKVLSRHGGHYGAPFFHYDYLRDHHSDIPSAHINVHASNDEMTRVMLQCGAKSRGKKRRKDFVDKGTFPTVSSLHFPLGGNLFRPSLEDILEMLVTEFGIDTTSDWKQCLINSRRNYRTIQLKTLIREHPEIAIEVLKDAGLVFDENTVPEPKESKIDRLIVY